MLSVRIRNNIFHQKQNGSNTFVSVNLCGKLIAKSRQQHRQHPPLPADHALRCQLSAAAAACQAGWPAIGQSMLFKFKFNLKFDFLMHFSSPNLYM
jgi:hypothetical protein